MGKSSTPALRRAGLDTTKFAIVYPRQSSAEQVRENVYSLDRQLLLRDYAIADGFPAERVIVVEDDLGLSGRTIEKRPGFSRALRMIDAGEVGAIYVEDLTRLSRDERTVDQMIIAAACEASGTMIYMGRSWYDMRDAAQRMSYKYQAVGLSESWKSHLDKLHAAQREKARQGKVAGRAPRGYRVNREGGRRDPQRDRLVVHPGEAAVIRAYAARLPQAGSLYKLYDAMKPTYWPDGSEVAFAAIRNILKSPIHRGTYAWGDVWIEGAHEAIIPPEQAAEIDHVLKLNRSTQRGRGDARWGELAGLVRCAACNRAMYTHSDADKPAYACERRVISRTEDRHYQLSTKPVDGLVREHLWARLAAGDLVDGILANIRRARAARTDARGFAGDQVAQLERKVEGWVRSLGDPDLQDLVRKAVQAQLDEALRELEALRAREDAPGSALDEAPYLRLKAEPGFVALLPASWEDEPIRWRRSFLRRFVESVTLAEGPGGFDVAIAWLDGTTTRHALAAFRPDWTPREQFTLLALRLNTHCPKTNRGRTRWLVERMAAAGYVRSYEAIMKQLRLITARGVTLPELAAAAGVEA